MRYRYFCKKTHTVTFRHAILLPLFLLLFTPSLLAWGPTGHRVTGLIAEKYMSENALKNVQKILGGESIAMVSTFMDEIKSDKKYDHLRPWHYCTIPDGMTYDEAGTPEEGDAVYAIEKLTEELRTKEFTQGDEAFTLKLLIHLIGDIHQPLHVGNGTDRGGNDVSVRYFSRNSNLHRVWDSGMINGTRLSYTEYAEWINRPDDDEVRKWQNSTVRDWAHESMTFRPAIYDLPANKKLSFRYDYDHKETLNLRLLQAGVRIAGVLNALYG